MRVVLVEDHPVVCRGITQLVNEQPGMEVCGEADTVDGALGVIEREQPDVVLVDLRLRDSNGLDLLRALRQQYPDIKALVLSMHAEIEYIEGALRAGARGYVTKDEADEKIIEALRKVEGGGLYLDETTSAIVLQRMVVGPEKSLDDQVNELSQRERAVFQLMGQGKNTREIADRLRLNLKTVETYRRRIRAKLGIPTMTKLSHTAFEFVQGQKKV